jgi:peptide/nickel transport system permease protein
MTHYLIRRTVQAIPLLLAITVVVFALMRMVPGGPLSIYENNPSVTGADLERLREQLGLNEPLPLQYARWLGNVVRGDWGWSLVTHRPVLEMVGERVGNTLYLMGTAFLVTLLIAIPTGVISAIRQYSWFDHAGTLFAFVGNSVPTFWSGLMAIIVFHTWFRAWGLPYLPAQGMYTLGGADTGLLDRLAHLVLPVSVLALFSAAHYTRYVRASMLEVIHQDYVRTARAKGLAEGTVVLRHALKNAAIPLVTIIALDLPQLFSGALITESIFAWPGIGRLFLEAATRFDYAVLMAILTITAALVVFFNLVADIAYGVLDPRIRYS